MSLRRLAVAVGAIVIGCAPGCGEHTDTSARYNVLLISLDTVRRDFLGSYGHRPRRAPEVAPTPRLDGLAAEGVRMLDARAPTSWTLPSHLSLLTGTTPLTHGVDTEAGVLARDVPTLAERLQRAGYRTFGVYSAPFLDPHWGFARGFERYEPVFGPELMAASQRSADSRAAIARAAAAGDWARYDELRREQTDIERELNAASERAVTSDGVTAAVTARLRELADGRQPWFVFAHFFDAHCDLAPPPPYDARFDPDYAGAITGSHCLTGGSIAVEDPTRPGGIVRRLSDRDLDHVLALYEGEIAWVDAHVGTILDELDALGLAARTLVVVTSDHGEEYFEHGNLGHRKTLFDEVVRVPILLRLPGVLPAGATVPGTVSLADVVPTILEILGLPSEGQPGVSSFLPAMRGLAPGEPRGSLARLVMMFLGNVAVDAGEPITFRQVMVQDVFTQGHLKLTRTRRWPQFPAGLSPELQTLLQQEAGTQYAREELTWIDVAKFPDEPAERQSADFGDPAAQAALGAFQRTYAASVRPAESNTSPLPANVRRSLESLGYLKRAAGPTFPEPDVRLPPPTLP
jgi:arylsulfatase A-like enzyme